MKEYSLRELSAIWDYTVGQLALIEEQIIDKPLETDGDHYPYSPWNMEINVEIRRILSQKGGQRGMTAKEIHAELENRIEGPGTPNRTAHLLNYGVRLGSFRRSGGRRFHVSGRLKK